MSLEPEQPQPRKANRYGTECPAAHCYDGVETNNDHCAWDQCPLRAMGLKPITPDRRGRVCEGSHYVNVNIFVEDYAPCIRCGTLADTDGRSIGQRLTAEEFQQWLTRPRGVLTMPKQAAIPPRPVGWWSLCRAVAAGLLRDLADWIEP